MPVPPFAASPKHPMSDDVPSNIYARATNY